LAVLLAGFAGWLRSTRNSCRHSAPLFAMTVVLVAGPFLEPIICEQSPAVKSARDDYRQQIIQLAELGY
jgi:hypothetical protein